MGMQFSWTVTKRWLIHSLSGRMILRITLVEFREEEHVASLCLSTWLLSYTHTAHVLPSEWRSSTHTPQDSGRNIYLVCVKEWEINPRRFLCVWIMGDFCVVLTVMEELYLACWQTTVVVCCVSAILFSHRVVITSEIISDFFKSLNKWRGFWFVGPGGWGMGGHHGWASSTHSCRLLLTQCYKETWSEWRSYTLPGFTFHTPSAGVCQVWLVAAAASKLCNTSPPHSWFYLFCV